LSLLTAAFFVVASVLQLVLAFELTGPPPPPPVDFLDNTFTYWVWDNSRWPIEFASTVLFALGFVMLAGLGVLLADLGDKFDARRRLAASAFLGAGAIGAAAELVWIAVKPFATQPHLCECNLRAEEIWARKALLDATAGVQQWLIVGAIILVAIGMVLAAGLARADGMRRGWVWLSFAVAAAGLAAAVVGVLGPYPINQLSVLAVAGLLVPIWAIWLAIEVPNVRLSDADEGEPPEPGQPQAANA